MPKVDQDKCIGCGMCVSMCPDCFKLNDTGKAESTCTGDNCECNCDLDSVVASCPVGAISK